MKTSTHHNISWGENVIIADADYIDRVAFNLIVNFERMIGRHIPKADMGQADYVTDDNESDGVATAMEHFIPALKS